MPASKYIVLGTGLRYHYLEWDEAASKKTLVLVHGFLDNAWSWEPVVKEGLASDYHVIAPDMRGHGDSDRIGKGGYYHFPDYIADLALFVKELGRDTLYLVGHSMGGTIGSYFAGSFPDQVDKLVMLEGLGPPEMSQSIADRIALWPNSWAQGRKREPRKYSSIDEAAARLKAYDPKLSDDLARSTATKGTQKAQDGSFVFKHDPLHLTRGPYPFQVATAHKFWSRITCPVLLVDAAESKLKYTTDEHSRRISAFSNPTRKTISAAGHMMHRHQPIEVAKTILKFLA